MRVGLFAFAVACAPIVWCTPARASEIVQDVSGNQRNFGQVQLFDPSLGTLQVVKVTGTMDFNFATIRSNQFDLSALSFPQTTTGRLSLFFVAPFATPTLTGTEVYPEGALGGSVSLSGEVFEILTGSDVNLFLGTAAEAISPEVASFQLNAGTPLIDPGTLIRYSLSFTYIYAPSGVPEPTTWAMMLLGFLGVGFVRRRPRAANLHPIRH